MNIMRRKSEGLAGAESRSVEEFAIVSSSFLAYGVFLAPPLPACADTARRRVD
jgi:hypothetical protein